MQDWQLLQEFVKRDSQAAFGQLVERHLNFVYSICLRELQDSGLAEDATQVVFLLLSQKARRLRQGTVLTGWLFQTARFVAKNARKQDIRWRNRTQKGAEEMMHEANTRPSAEAEVWTEIQPLLHDALGNLNAADRDAVLLRCFEGRSLKETGEALNISEEAARKRVTRALDKLRRYFARHGVTMSVAALLALLGENAVQAAPLAASGVTSAVLGVKAGALGTAALGAQTLNLAANVKRAWLLLKIKTAATVVCGATLIAAGTQHFSRPEISRPVAPVTTAKTVVKTAPSVKFAALVPPKAKRVPQKPLVASKTPPITPKTLIESLVVEPTPTKKASRAVILAAPRRVNLPAPEAKNVAPKIAIAKALLPPVKLPAKAKGPLVVPSPSAAIVAAPGKTNEAVSRQVLTREQISQTPPRDNEKDEDMQLKKTMGSALVGAAIIASALVPQAANAADGDKGTVTGVLTGKGEGWIEVKADDAKEAKRWRPRWIGGLPKDGGGFDKAVLESFKKLPVPNRVKLNWVTEEGPRVVGVELLAPKDKAGAVEGEVTAKGENWVEVKAGDAPAERYSPRWIGGLPKDGGGFDKDTIRAIGEVKVGDKVRLEWTYEERLRVVSLKKQ